MAKRNSNATQVKAEDNATLAEQVTPQVSSVFDQTKPLPEHLSLVPTPSEPETSETPDSAKTNRKYSTREAWGTEALSRIYDLLSKDKMEGDRITRVAYKNLPEKKHILVSANAPLAKRAKRGDGIVFQGRTAAAYPPSMSEDGATWQIFLASQIDHDLDYVLLLFGQVARILNWEEEGKNKSRLYAKKTKDLLLQFGFLADEDCGALAVKNIDAAKEVTALFDGMGPSGFVRIDVKPSEAKAATANRGARIYCKDPACACKQTEAGKNKKNATGGYFSNSSDAWGKAYLELAKLEIPTSSTVKETVLTGMRCPFAAFGGDPEASLVITWSEYEIEQRLAKETGKASELR